MVDMGTIFFLGEIFHLQVASILFYLILLCSDLFPGLCPANFILQFSNFGITDRRLSRLILHATCQTDQRFFKGLTRTILHNNQTTILQNYSPVSDWVLLFFFLWFSRFFYYRFYHRCTVSSHRFIVYLLHYIHFYTAMSVYITSGNKNGPRALVASRYSTTILQLYAIILTTTTVTVIIRLLYAYLNYYFYIFMTNQTLYWEAF